MKITQRFVDSLKAPNRDTFHRDGVLKGFAVKITKGGTVSFIVEAKVQGRSKRIKIGNHPSLSVADARIIAAKNLNQMRDGIDPVKLRKTKQKEEKRREAKDAALSVSLGAVFDSYMQSRSHKTTTKRDYQNTMKVVFGDWLERPLREISRKDIEDRFVNTRDNRGKAQATKAMRILSAIMNFAMADEIDGERLITENPCDVLKQKKVDRSISKRVNYLDESDIQDLFHFFFSVYEHPEAPRTGVTKQGINYILILLSTGLRKSEAFGIKWHDIDWKKRALVVRDTKNGTDHWIPISKLTKWVLERQRVISSESEWVFPARTGDSHMTEPKSQLQRIIKATGVQFSLHDCRRTFATHAKINGLDHDIIRRALNHKSGGTITDSYIQGGIALVRPAFDAVADQYQHYYLGEATGKAAYDTKGDLLTVFAEESDFEDSAPLSTRMDF